MNPHRSPSGNDWNRLRGSHHLPPAGSREQVRVTAAAAVVIAAAAAIDGTTPPAMTSERRAEPALLSRFRSGAVIP